MKRTAAAVAWTLLLISSFGSVGGAVAARADDGEDLAPRPLAEAERAAVELASRYLAEGAAAWRERLAPDHPWSALAPDAARREIEVRAGPPGGSTWTLQTPAPGTPEDTAIFSVVFPSGADETVILRLVPPADGTDGAGWNIAELRTLSEPAPTPEETFFDQPIAAAPPVDRESAPGRGPELPRWAVLLLPLLLLTLPVAVFLRGLLRSRRRSGAGRGDRAAAVTARSDGSAAPASRRAIASEGAGTVVPALALLLALVLACAAACGEGGSGAAGSGGPGGGTAAAGADAPTSLGALRDLRWALATDGDPVALAERVATEAPEGLPRQVADLWRAQLLLRQVDLADAESILSGLPEPGPVPLADLLRARLATARGKYENASWSYDQVRFTGPDHDGLRMEIVGSLATLGLEHEVEVEMIQLAEMGSREAEVWYTRARIFLIDDEEELGGEALRTAWAAQPIQRDDLFDDPLLATLIARPSLFGLIEPGSPVEPTVQPDDLGRHGFEMPAGARSTLLGRLLRVEIGGERDSELQVPGGAGLAPVDVRLMDAGSWKRREYEEALARLDTLTEQATAMAALGQPRLRRELMKAGAALADADRWEELVLLTDGLDGQISRVPPVLAQLRALALRETSRPDEAQALLVDLAKATMESRRPAPGVLYQLAELFVTAREFDVAMRLIRKAGSLSPLARNEARLQQIRLEKWLYDDFERHWSDHFEIIYPKMTGGRYATQLGTVLEAERERIGHWIPLRSGAPIEVDLFPLERFVRAFSGGSLVLGLYDGRVRVPFADLRSLHPQLVSILSHEVAHALIGQATNEQAPDWFHEGLAQHVEMLPGRVNPIPDLHRTDRVISLPMIEAILDGYGEPELTDLAYGEAAWVVHYLEAVHGVRSIHAMTRAFARGLDTEEALREVLGMGVAEFDAAVWEWCLTDAPGSWPTRLVRYDQELSSPVRRSGTGDGSPTQGGRSSAERGFPSVGRRADEPLTMTGWHAAYSRRVAPFKRSLGGLLGPLRRGEAPLPAACVTLSGQIQAIARDPVALHPPDPRAARALQTAFGHFAAMAASCGKEQTRSAQTSLARAERALGTAAAALERYGVQP